MSGKKKSTDATGDTGAATVDDDVQPPDDTESAAADPVADAVQQKSPGRLSGVVAWLALFISTVAVAAVAAFAFIDNRSAEGEAAQSSAELRAVSESLNATQEALATLEQSVSALEDLDTQRNERIDSLGRQLNDRLRQLESMPGRLSSVEASMASIQGISTGARDAWLLAEAEYYMQIANAQLQLANNAELASIALQHADERILQLADPRLTRVRQALSDELRSLEAIAKPDIAGITLTLASLAGAVDSLPLKHEVVVREGQNTEIDPELTGMDRALASLRSAVGGVVSVRRADEAMQPLIAPEAQYFLRANLALQLQAARLALLRGEENVFRQSLDDADAWLEEYYDPGNNAVQSARETISNIRGSVFSVAMPDISQSLRRLRQFNTLASASQSDEPVPNNPEPEQ